MSIVFFFMHQNTPPVGDVECEELFIILLLIIYFMIKYRQIVNIY